MGLFNIIRDALGMRKRLEPGEAGPFGFTDAAREALAALPDGQGLHVSTAPAAGGWVVQADVGESFGPPPPGFDDLRFTAGDIDLERLRGLQLDYRDGRWAVNLDLELRARETPNPDGRLYLCSRYLAVGRPLFFTHETTAPALAERLLDIQGVKSVLFRDHTVTVEREPGTVWDSIDGAVDAQLREYFLMCGPTLDADHMHRDDPLEQEVMQVLEQHILPAIHRDGGDLQLAGITDGIVKVHMVGACRSCPASAVTLTQGVERALMEAFPGRIHGVEAV